MTTREEILAKLTGRHAESQSCLQRNFGPAAFGVVSLHNQITCLEALSYLVEHQTEQAGSVLIWRRP